MPSPQVGLYLVLPLWIYSLLGIARVLENPIGRDSGDFPRNAFMTYMMAECDAFSAGSEELRATRDESLSPPPAADVPFVQQGPRRAATTLGNTRRSAAITMQAAARRRQARRRAGSLVGAIKRSAVGTSKRLASWATPAAPVRPMKPTSANASRTFVVEAQVDA